MMRATETHAPSSTAHQRGVAGWLIIASLALAIQTRIAASNSTDSRTTPRSIALRIDPNSASRAELTLLPGIGPELADAIITFRESSERRPAFRDESDLDRVPRIGPSVLGRARDMLRFPSVTEPHREPQP
jgi:DNA uptake protein ComE-like DNA-binding protein